MPDTVYNLYDAKTHLSKLVDRAANGEVILIAKGGKPLARLVGRSRYAAGKRKKWYITPRVAQFRASSKQREVYHESSRNEPI